MTAGAPPRRSRSSWTAPGWRSLTWDRSEPPRFYDVEYPIPARLVEGRESVTVRLQAKPDSQIATVFGLRMVRADELR